MSLKVKRGVIKERMKALGINPAEMAERCGVPLGSWYKIMEGRTPARPTIKLIAIVLQMTESELLEPQLSDLNS